jgi:hypothetical protein
MCETALRGERYGYFGATYKLLTEVWDEVARTMAPVIVTKNKTEARMTFSTGGIIEFWTLEDGDAGRSRRYHEVGIDEAGLVKNLEKVWYEAIRPTLADYRGSAFFAGTPKGQNFFASAFAMGQDPMNDEWASWQMPTTANPFIDPEEIEAARKGMPDRSFRQEFLAEFIEEAGGVFRGVRDAVSVGVKGPRKPTGEVRIGLDLARVEDFTVLSAVDDRGIQVDFERFNQISWERQIGAVETFCSKYANSTLWLDSTGVGDPIYERLRASQALSAARVRVEGYKLSNQSKEDLINNLAMLIEQKRVDLLDLPEQTNELLAYQYELTESRNVRMNAPAGMHDDTVIALALATWTAKVKLKRATNLKPKARRYT